MSECPLSDDELRDICAIADRQTALIDQMHAALVANDDKTVIQLARKICHLEDEMRR